MHAKLRAKYQRSGKQQVEKQFECEGPTRDQHWKVIAAIGCREKEIGRHYARAGGNLRIHFVPGTLAKTADVFGLYFLNIVCCSLLSPAHP